MVYHIIPVTDSGLVKVWQVEDLIKMDFIAPLSILLYDRFLNFILYELFYPFINKVHF
jgi:hypothetical protein